MMIKLEYKQWRRFCNTIYKVKLSCINSNTDIKFKFTRIGNIVKTGISTKKIEDFKLSRYDCYLIAQNSDPRKKVVAFAKIYFAVQTRNLA